MNVEASRLIWRRGLAGLFYGLFVDLADLLLGSLVNSMASSLDLAWMRAKPPVERDARAEGRGEAAFGGEQEAFFKGLLDELAHGFHHLWGRAYLLALFIRRRRFGQIDRVWRLFVDLFLGGCRVCVRTNRLQNQSRRACPELVERGRLNFRIFQLAKLANT
jgi:hypothetical protein